VGGKDAAAARGAKTVIGIPITSPFPRFALSQGNMP
jgi:hypothetical protein